MRRLQRWLAIASSIALIYALVEQTSGPIVALGLVYVIAYSFVVYDLTKGPGSVVLHLFLLLFTIGHVLKTSIVLGNIEVYRAIGWNTVGAFDFSPRMMAELFAVETVGMFAAFLTFKLFLGPGYTQTVYSQPLVRRMMRMSPTVLSFAWFFFAILIIYLVQSLGFGKHGLATPEESRLPFRLGGILLYTRNVFVFATGLILFDVLSQWRQPVRTNLFYLLYTIAAFYLAFASLSRTAMIATMLPLLYVWLRGRKLGMRAMLRLAMAGLLFVYITVSVTSYRSGIYSGETLVSDKQIGLIAQTLAGFDTREILLFSDFLITRAEGSRELMAVLSAPGMGLSPFWRVFATPDGGLEESIWGFLLEGEGLAFGRSYGMLGMLYISKSLIVVFLGVSLYIWALLRVERTVLSRGYVATSFFISFMLFIFVWMNMTWFFILRFSMILIALYFFVVLFLEKCFRAPRLLAGQPKPNMGPQLG